MPLGADSVRLRGRLRRVAGICAAVCVASDWVGFLADWSRLTWASLLPIAERCAVCPINVPFPSGDGGKATVLMRAAVLILPSPLSADERMTWPSVIPLRRFPGTRGCLLCPVDVPFAAWFAASPMSPLSPLCLLCCEYVEAPRPVLPIAGDNAFGHHIGQVAGSRLLDRSRYLLVHLDS